MMKNVRDNYRLIYEDRKLADDLGNKFLSSKHFVVDGIAPLELNERFRFYRYDSGQRFKRHIDGRVIIDNIESRVTFMIYLNNDYEGGETKFDHITIIPKKGLALCFIHEQKHESVAITNGVKYVLRSDIMYKI